MIKEVEKIIINNNIKLYGKDVIKYYVIEETSELQKELVKDLRGKQNREHITEEISDVYYALSMLKQLYNISDDEINESIAVKEQRSLSKMSI